MCFVGYKPLGLDVDTVTGNLYFASGIELKRSAKNGNTLETILHANTVIFGIAIDPLNR